MRLQRQYKLFIFFRLLILKVYGGEGEIRTPDSLATMSDFESGAFNRALPPLRVLSSFYQPLARIGAQPFSRGTRQCPLGAPSVSEMNQPFDR